MLTRQLAKLRDALVARGSAKRTSSENELLVELQEIEAAIGEANTRKDQPLVDKYMMKAAANVRLSGPTPGECPTCGGKW